MPIRRAIRFARRNKFLVAATALLMAGAGCVGAVNETGKQLTHDALTPISVPVKVYKMGLDAASSTDASQKAQMDQSGLEDQ
jgi:hypothetical protein